MKGRMVVVHDGSDYYLVNYIGSNLKEAQELFDNGELEPVYRFTFFNKIRSELKYL
jgi:hypothetical protein